MLQLCSYGAQLLSTTIKMHAILLATRAGIKHAAIATNIDACFMPFTLWYGATTE